MDKYLINKSWDFALNDKKNEIEAILSQVNELRKNTTILPKQNEIFNALLLTNFENVKVLIIGEDPYPSSEHAHGLAFSSLSNNTPASLKNIFKAIQKDIPNCSINSNNLENWARQGVLLLNTSLTYQDKVSKNFHFKLWKPIVQSVFEKLKQRKKILVVMRWGSKAQKVAEMFEDTEYIKILDSVHPSPLSAYKGFMECQHFKICNEILTLSGEKPINWNTL